MKVNHAVRSSYPSCTLLSRIDEISSMEQELYSMISELDGLKIPLNQPKGGINEKRLRGRGGETSADFPSSNVVDAPLNKNAN
jgi:hypothetical protein